MPDLYFKVGVKNGKATITELEDLDAAYDKTGKSGTKSFKEGEKAASVFGGTLNNIKSIVAGLGITMGAVQLGQMFALGIRNALSFESQMANVSSIMAGSRDQVAALEQGILNLGGELGNSAQLANALYEAISAGVEPAEGIEFVATAAKLAKAELFDAGAATKLLATIMNAYGREIIDVNHVSDVFVKTINFGIVRGDELADSLGAVISTASMAKVSIEEVSAAVAIMTRAGLSGAESTTALNQALLTYISPTKQAKELARALGIDLSATALQSKGFAAVLQEVADKTQGDIEVINELFSNVRAGKAVMALTGAQAADFTKLIEEMKVAAGDTDDAFEVQQKTISNQWSKAINESQKILDRFIMSIKENAIGTIQALNSLFKDGVAPINEYTVALGTFGFVLAGLKIGAFVTAMKSAASASTMAFLLGSIKNLGDLRAALQLGVGSLGKFGQAALVAGAAFAGWKIGRWISELFDLDKKLGDVWTKLGLFQGRVKEMQGQAEAGLQKASENMKKNAETVAMAAKMGESLDKNGRSAEEWAAAIGRVSQAMVKQRQQQDETIASAVQMRRVQDLQKEYGEKLKLLNVDLSRGTRTLAEWTAAIDEAAKKVKDKIPLTEEETEKVKALTTAMTSAINPALELAQQLDLLGRAGKSSAGFVQVFSKQILDAIDMNEQMGTKVPATIAALKAEAQAFEEAKKKVADLQAERKKLKELEEKGVPTAIAGLQNKELRDNAKAWIEYAASVAKANNPTLTQAEAIEEGVKRLKEFDQIVTKNKENLREQSEEFAKQHSIIEIVKKDYEILGISMDKSTLLMERAYRKQRDTGLMSIKAQTDAVANMVQTATEQHEQLSADVIQDLESLAFGTDVNVREKMMPVWQEYYKSLRDRNGAWPAEYVAKLNEVMKGNNAVLKKEMLPQWNDYIESVKKIYGKLPPDLEKVNNVIQEQMGDAAGKLAQVWKEQVSTIFTDFSKGVSDMIFEAKSMSDTIVGIFREFGKMVVRTLIEALMNPFKKMMSDVIGDIVGTFSKGSNDVNSSWGGGARQGTFGNILGGAGGVGGIFDLFTKNGSADKATSENPFQGNGPLQSYGNQSGSGGGIFGVGGKAGSLMQSAMLMGGTSLFMSGVGDWRSNSASSWLKSIGGGAMAGAAIGSMIPVIGTAIGAVVGAAVGALSKGIGSLVSWAKGKTNQQAGVDEIARDYGGIKMSQEMYNQLTESFGFDPNGGALWKVRGDVAASPQMMQQMYELARQQGKTAQFMASLDKNYGGGYNFDENLEIGTLTGDYTRLNETWKTTAYYQDLVNRGLKSQADAMMIDGDAALEAAKSFETFYQEAIKTGKVTDEFTDFIEENRDKLNEYAKESKLVTEQLRKMDEVMQIMKAHAAELDQLEAFTNGMQTLKDGLEAFGPAIKTSLDVFLEKGIITDDFRDKLNKLGADVKAFEAVAGSMKTSNYFGQLVEQFKQTGEVLPDLKVLFQQFGGSLDELKDASVLKKLKQANTDLTDFADGIKSLMPETTGLQDALNGIYDAQKLAAQGLDAGMFKSITGLIGAMNEWDAAVQDFKQTGRLTEGGIPDIARQVIKRAGLTTDQLDKVQDMFKGNEKKLTSSGKLITDMLSQYGGAEGQHAVEMLKSGFNVVTSDLLAQTKTSMDNAYKTERDKVLSYIQQQQSEILNKSQEIEQAIESQFQVVSTNIQKAFVDARVIAIEQIDMIMGKLDDITKQTIGLVSAPAGTMTAAEFLNTTGQAITSNTTMMAKFIAEIQKMSAEQASQAEAKLARPTAITVQIDNNGNIYQNDLETRVLQIMKDALAGGAFTGVIQ